MKYMDIVRAVLMGCRGCERAAKRPPLQSSLLVLSLQGTISMAFPYLKGFPAAIVLGSRHSASEGRMAEPNTMAGVATDVQGSRAIVEAPAARCPLPAFHSRIARCKPQPPVAGDGGGQGGAGQVTPGAWTPC